MTHSWYALHSKPNKEEFLRDQLARNSIEHFYPFLVVTPVNPRSRKTRPYFPGYLFVHLDLEASDTAHLIQWMPGSAGLVSFDHSPAEVPSPLIAAIKQRVVEDFSERKQQRIFTPGDKVEILNGPFEGYQGIFEKAQSGSERVRILIELLRGHALKLDIPEKSIKKKKD